MGGIIIGYEIGKLLNIETIFCERVEKKFVLRRGFHIKKNSKVLIVEDVITTGKSSLECAKLINKFGAKLAGFSCIINRSDKNKLKILNSHPDLGDKTKIGSLTPDSKKEQSNAGLDQCSEEEFNEFKNLNNEYKQKFHHFPNDYE